MTIEQEEYRKLPKVFSHRGYSGKYPENTLISFEEALKANTDALEGDIRLSKDKEIVMMHDLTLQRTTTGHGPVSDHPWVGYIDGLTTKTEQPQPIPRFRDVLDLLIRPDTALKQDLTMIVDIKFDNDIEILDHLYALIEEEYKDHVQVLRRQLIIGIWNPEYLKKTRELFKNHYQVCFIGISLPGARKHFLHHVDYFSLPFAAYVDTEGQQFIQQVHELKKKVLTWTINDVEQMRSSVVWGLDGVVGDHVDLLLDTVQHQVLALSTEEYQAFLDSFQHIKSRRSRWYYYCMKKGMQVGSAFIGV